MSNRWIAGRLGLSEKAVRKSLRRLGWKPGPEPSLSFLPEARSQVQLAVASASTLLETPPPLRISLRRKCRNCQPKRLQKSRRQPSRSVHGLSSCRHGTSRRCPSGVCCHTKLAKGRRFVGHSSARGQWLLSTAEKIYGSLGPPSTDYEQLWLLCSVGAFEDSAPGNSPGVSAWGTGPHCRPGSYARSEDSAPQTRPPRCSQGQLYIRA